MCTSSHDTTVTVALGFVGVFLVILVHLKTAIRGRKSSGPGVLQRHEILRRTKWPNLFLNHVTWVCGTTKTFARHRRRGGGGARGPARAAQRAPLRALHRAQRHRPGRGGGELAGALQANTSLRRLYSWGNRAGAAAAPALGSGLPENRTLTALSFRCPRCRGRPARGAAACAIL